MRACRYVAQNSPRRRRYAAQQVCPGSVCVCVEMEQNTSRSGQVHHILHWILQYVFVDLGNTRCGIKAGRNGIWFVLDASYCRLNPDTWERRAHHMHATQVRPKGGQMLFGGHMHHTSTRILVVLSLLFPCQAALPADVNLFYLLRLFIMVLL